MVIADGAAAGTMTPFILVEPQMQLSYRQATECTDLPGQPKVGTFFEQDVPDLIKRTFRALPDRTGWGVGGIIDGYFVIDSTWPPGRPLPRRRPAR